MSDKYKNCEARLTCKDKQNFQRAMDKLFFNINRRINPCRKKEEDVFYTTMSEFKINPFDVRRELSSFMGFNSR